jgi:hypothetical protein
MEPLMLLVFTFMVLRLGIKHLPGIPRNRSLGS